jgi:hypothetical protein
VVPSGFGRGDHFADAAVGVTGKEWPDVLSHPRAANLLRDAIRILGGGEFENQDQLGLVDPRNSA